MELDIKIGELDDVSLSTLKCKIDEEIKARAELEQYNDWKKIIMAIKNYIDKYGKIKVVLPEEYNESYMVYDNIALSQTGVIEICEVYSYGS